MFRWSYLLLFAITWQLNSSIVEAGVIVSVGDLEARVTESPSACGVPPCHRQGQDEQGSVEKVGSTSGLGGNAEVSRGNVRLVSLPLERVAMHSVAGLCWRVSIENSTLPGLPALEGLLKPS